MLGNLVKKWKSLLCRMLMFGSWEGLQESAQLLASTKLFNTVLNVDNFKLFEKQCCIHYIL